MTRHRRCLGDLGPLRRRGDLRSQARIIASGDALLATTLYLAATSQAIADKRTQLDDFVARVDRAYAWPIRTPTNTPPPRPKSPACHWPCMWAVAKETV